MSLSALLFPLTALLLVLTLLTGSKELLDESDPLLLRSHQSAASGFVLFHFLKSLFMGFERLMKLVQCFWCAQQCELFEFVVPQAFWVEDQMNIRRFRRRNMLQSCSTGSL